MPTGKRLASSIALPTGTLRHKDVTQAGTQNSKLTKILSDDANTHTHTHTHTQTKAGKYKYTYRSGLNVNSHALQLKSWVGPDDEDVAFKQQPGEPGEAKRGPTRQCWCTPAASVSAAWALAGLPSGHSSRLWAAPSSARNVKGSCGSARERAHDAALPGCGALAPRLRATR